MAKAEENRLASALLVYGGFLMIGVLVRRSFGDERSGGTVDRANSGIRGYMGYWFGSAKRSTRAL